ncbi:transcription termination/antitermination protein NusG [Erythrobacter ramosus]|nr:transcription termination/antitermination NusG family protein [Erythrobacter ramosus]MXP39968.1 transcriptional activator RfaH [Erythrobacter ramosus]
MVEWRLVQVRPNADSIAIRNVERQGFSVFRPLEIVTSIRGGRFVSRLRSFFPGYMFAGYAGPAAPWSVINSTYGVARLVKFGDRPTTVPNRLVAELQAACDDQGVISLASRIMAGASVEVASGSLAGFIGEVERLTPDQRALVLIEFLGKQTRVSLPVAQLKVASQHSDVARHHRE